MDNEKNVYVSDVTQNRIPEEIQPEEKTPLEKYSFCLTADEHKKICKKQTVPDVIILILALAYLLYCLYCYVNSGGLIFAICCGIALYYIAVCVTRMSRHIRSNKENFERAAGVERYITVYDDGFKLENYEQGVKYMEETRRFSDIESVSDLGELYLFGVIGRGNFVRKKDLVPGSRLLFELEPKAKKQKRSRIIRGIGLAVLALVFLITMAVPLLVHNNGQYDGTVMSLIEEQVDGERELVKHIVADDDGEIMKSFVLVENDGGEIDLWSYYEFTDDEGEVRYVLRQVNEESFDFKKRTELISHWTTGDDFTEYACIVVSRSSWDIPSDASFIETVDWNGDRVFVSVSYAD